MHQQFRGYLKGPRLSSFLFFNVALLNPAETGLPETTASQEEKEEAGKDKNGACINIEDDDEEEEDDDERPRKASRRRPRRRHTSSGDDEDEDQEDKDHAVREEEERGVSDAAAALRARIHDATEEAAALVTTAPTPESQQLMKGEHASSQQEPAAASPEVAFAVKQAQLQRQRACVAYLKEMKGFMGHVATAIEDVKTMLHAKTVTDVLEAIEFFLVLRQAGVRNLDGALRHMMAMIWSHEEPIRKAVLDASR